MRKFLDRIFKRQGPRVEGAGRRRSDEYDLLMSLGREQLERLKRKGLSIPVIAA